MSFYSGSLLFTALSSLLLGIFVFLKGTGKTQNRTLALFSAALFIWCFGQFMGEIAAAKEAVLFWTRVGLAGAIFLPIFFLHFIFSLVENRENRLLGMVYVLGTLFLGFDFTPLFVADVMPALSFRFYPKAGIIYLPFAFFILGCFGYGLFLLFKSYREAAGARKNQILYVIIASLIGSLGGATSFLPVWGIDFPVLSHFALPLYLLIAVYAIVMHHLLDITLIVREGLIYSTLTVLFAGFYVLAILVTNYLLSHLVVFDPTLTIFLVVFVSVLVFQPLRDNVQKWVDRLFYQGEYRYQKTIDHLSNENRQLFRSLLQADKLAALGTISAGMAHEIKNPLASIKGMTQVLEENLADPNFIKKYQEVVCRQIDRMNNLVEKLLRFGHPPGLTLAQLELNQVIEETLALLSDQCKKKGIRIDLELGKLPQMEGDFEQLEQLFMNLILNAIQAMPDGGVLSIRTSSLSLLCVEISDSGIGIPDDKIDRIFDPFFSTRDEGVGMGLAVAYRIVKEHGGRIQVESKVGKGTTFKLWLPLQPKLSA